VAQDDPLWGDCQLLSVLGDFYSINGDLKYGIIYNYKKSIQLKNDIDDDIFYIDTVGGLAFVYRNKAEYEYSIKLFETISGKA
jgi:hypothetical protein